MTQDENPERITQIALQYFRKETGSDEQAMAQLEALAKTVSEDGAKLVHLGNVLFLVLVRGEGVVEVHTIGEESPAELAEDFRKLVAYLKNIGVKTAYTYAESKRFGRLAKMTGLPVQEFAVDFMGKPATAYVMEF